jgi:hypothetical protein
MIALLQNLEPIIDEQTQLSDATLVLAGSNDAGPAIIISYLLTVT